MSGSNELQWGRRDWSAVVAFLALAHVVFWPALQGHVFLYGRDTTAHDYGLLLFHWSHVLEHGGLALWNPYLFCGLPSLGTFAFCPFYPSTWLFAFLPFWIAFNWQYILNDWLAGLWTYWAARWMGMGRAGAFFAALVFMASGHVVTLVHAGHLQKFAAIAWTPFVFGCATAAMESRRWRFWLGCAFGLAMQLLASHVQIAYYTALFLFAWVAWRSAWQGGSDRTGAAAWNLGGLVLAVVVSISISAAQLFPALETTPLSNRASGVDFGEAAETSYPPLEFAEYLLPGFMGDSAGGPVPYWGNWGSERIVSDYMGLLPIILFVYALAARARRDCWFWLAAIVVAALMAAGSHTPVFRVAFHWLPGLNRFRSPATIMVFIAWPVALAAGWGLERFVERAGETRLRSYYALILACAAVGFLVLWAILATPSHLAGWLEPLGLSPGRGHMSRVAGIFASLRRSAVAGLACCGALGALALSGGPASAGRSVARVAALAAVFAVAFLDPRLHESRYVKAADVRPFHRYLFTHWSDAYLESFPPPLRGIETGNELTNRMMTRGIATLHGYHPIRLRKYNDLLRLYARDHAKLGMLVFERFVLAPERAGPGRQYVRRAGRAGQVLWLRRPPLLYAYFPEEVSLATDGEAVLAAMSRSDFNPYRRSYTLDRRVEFRRSSDRSTPTARVLRYSPDRIDIEVSTDRERPVIVAEIAAPGWRCLLDSGKQLPVAVANHAFRAVRVPAGNHVISLVYRPFSFRLGLYSTLVSLSLVVAAIVCGRRRAQNEPQERTAKHEGRFEAKQV